MSGPRAMPGPARGPAAPVVVQPVAAAALPGPHYAGLSALVAAAGAGGRAVLVQQRPVAHRVAGLLDALVLRRSRSLGVARRVAAHGPDPHAVARASRDDRDRATGR